MVDENQPAAAHQHYTYVTDGGYRSPFCWPTQEAAHAGAGDADGVTVIPGSPAAVPMQPRVPLMDAERGGAPPPRDH